MPNFNPIKIFAIGCNHFIQVGLLAAPELRYGQGLAPTLSPTRRAAQSEKQGSLQKR